MPHRTVKVTSNQVKADQQVLGFVSNLAGTFEYAGDAAQMETRLRSLDANIDKLLNLVTLSCVSILKYIRRSFTGELRDVYFESLADVLVQVEQ